MDPSVFLLTVYVTSYAEVWIEIIAIDPTYFRNNVTSYAEVWIEIKMVEGFGLAVQRHLLRGGVD